MKFLIVLFLFIGAIHSQADDTSGVDIEEDIEPAFTTGTSIYGDYSKSDGNTSADILYYGLTFDVRGDIGPLKDSEIFFSYSRSDSKLDGDQYENDENIISTIDIMANQYFISPFLFFQNQKDAIVNLKNRRNFGLGAKIRLPFGFSLSYALLPEEEIYDWEYISDSTYVEDEYYYDSGEWEYAFDSFDSTRTLTRHSIRPKVKWKFLDGNVVFDYRFYYKPNISNFEDFLLVNELKISISTFYEALSLSINYNDSYNSQYDYSGSIIKPKDSEISIGLSFDL